MKLSIIIVSYNTKELLKKTLTSLPWNDELEVIVVDNASQDGSAAMVSANFPKTKIIVKSENSGFARANNEGMKIATGDAYVLLNSDTEIIGNALTVLRDFLDKTPEAAAVTPKVVLPDGAIDLACHRGLPTPWNALTYFSGVSKIFPNLKWFTGYHQTYKDFESIHSIEATAATALMVRKKAVDEVGLLDERFFLYGEDLDWCKRFTDAGWFIYYHPGAKVLHYKSASGKKHTSSVARREAASHFYQTMKQFYEKHYQDKYPAWLRKLVYLGIDIKQKLHR